MRHISLSLIIILLTSAISLGQSKFYSTDDRGAIKDYKKGLVYLNNNDGENALKYFKKALDDDPNFIQAQLSLADTYYAMDLTDEAKVEYAKVIKLDPDFHKNPYLSLGEMAFLEERHDDAISLFEKYLTFDRIPYSKKWAVELYIEDSKFSKLAKANPVPFEPKNLGPNVNSIFQEYLPTLTADGKTLIITRKSDQGEDFYVAEWRGEEKGWSPAEQIKGPINTPLNEGAQCISADGQILFFTGCNRTLGEGSCDLYIALWDGDAFGTPINLGPPVNTRSWESQPSLAGDNQTLYFVSDRKGGYGRLDIWKTKLNNGIWSQPVNLGPTINTPGNEQCPFIHPDGTTLYFSSDGHVGMGGRDIFYSRLEGDTAWAKPTNLGYPINTIGEESSLIVSLDGKKAFFASDRLAKGTNLDLYSFELYPEARPEKVTYVKGTVFNKTTKKKLGSKFDLIDLETGEIVVTSASNRYTGEFLVTLRLGKDYVVNVSRDGYLFYSDNFSLKNVTADEPFTLDIPLTPIRVGETVVLKNIFFEFDSYNLKPESKIELDKLVEFIDQNEGITVEIGGHTDAKGDDAYNLKLSDDRAKAVMDFLVNAGIPAETLTSKGYGETMPVSDNDTEEGRAQNRRTEFKITGKQ